MLIQEAFDKSVPHHSSKSNDITFSKDELPSIEVKNRDDPLMITSCIYEQKIRGNLVDNGSALNICCVDLLDKINWDYSSIQPDHLCVRGFDNVLKESLGIVILPIKVGPMTLPTPIHVIPNHLNYNLLLGRPWIHAMNVVPSTLHRTIKFIYNNELHSIKADSSPYNFTYDEVGYISPFSTMIPSATPSPINDASKKGNWGTRDFTPSSNGYMTPQSKIQAFMNPFVSFIQAFEPISTSPNTCLDKRKYNG